MDSTILKLVLDNNAREFSNPRTRESQIKLWNRCIKKWNETHPITKVKLEDLANELYLRWPQMYIGYSPDSLYCSFSYVDYIFQNNDDGQICGGMFLREGKKPTKTINMTANQIVDLIGIIRPIHFMSRNRTREMLDVLTNRNDERCSGCSDHSQTALAWANRAWNLYDIGLVEEAQIACTNSLLYKRIACPDSRMGALEAEMHVLMGQIYYYTFQWELADYCFKKSYDQYYKIFERPDWRDVLYADVPKEERDEYDNNIVGPTMYQYWAHTYSTFLKETNRLQESEEINKLGSDMYDKIKKEDDDNNTFMTELARILFRCTRFP